MSYKSVKDVVMLLTENGFWFVRLLQHAEASGAKIALVSFVSQ